jgi:CRP-like cAMP-binding protein/Fe-S-cluster-containing hydrogenase component 2
MTRKLLGGPRRTPDRRPLFIPIDAPTYLDYESKQAFLYEGDLFGEMSCLFRTPRSATVVANRDCHVLEMLGSILDEVQGDADYRNEMGRLYKARVLELHLRQLPIFSDLTEEQLNRVRAEVELVSFKAGQVIFKENDRADSMYIVRSGVVKTVRHAADPLGREYVVAYQGKGDFIGEMGLITGQPRNATCVAYAHPEPGQGHLRTLPAKWRQKEDVVELVRINEDTFRWLREQNPEVDRKVREGAARRRQVNVELQAAPAWGDRGGVQQSGRFEELGLIQGQKLMLIDLNRCTRCDECVRACVDTHDDGRSRLFLDGPRFGKYLVPATCRSCLDPVCMIGCPVGSIHRGDNREIVIEDWCIGCGLCAVNCPYGSIRMHDIGLIPQEAHGWRYHPAPADGERWWELRYSDRRWLAGRSPFRYDADLKSVLEGKLPQGAGQAVGFRYAFEVPAEVRKSECEFSLVVTSPGGSAMVWLNGRPIEAPAKGDRREYRIARKDGRLHAGRNVVAAKVPLPPQADRQVLLDVRLDEVHLPAAPEGFKGEVSEKSVKERAVVCDLCSKQFGQRPACVNACPHDAALRVDARLEFPVR